MQLPRYESYKDSGVEWLGEIPEEWNLWQGFKLFKENKNKNSGMIEDTVLSLSYGRIVIKPEEKLHGLVPESFEGYQLIEPADTIIRTTDLQNDKTSLRCGYANDKGIITSAYLSLKPLGTANPKFTYYVLHAYDLLKVFYGMGSGLRQNLDFRDFKRMIIPIPESGVQERIVSFLDKKTAEIDEAIAKKKKLIELLQEQKSILINQAVTKGLNPDAPMKDSGVEWIGEIPAHWEVLYNRRIFRENSRKVTNRHELPLSLSQVDGLIPSKEMKERSLRPAHFNNFKVCLPDDLVVNRFKGHLGVFFASTHRGIVTFHYGVFEPQKKIETRYYEYLYHTPAYKCIYAGASNGMTVGLQNLSNQNFYDVKSLVPPINEQEEIVQYVEEIKKEYDSLHLKEMRQIDLLHEYKQSLISSAVTGEIKV